jgi:hypothetical protein
LKIYFDFDKSNVGAAMSAGKALYTTGLLKAVKKYAIMHVTISK